MIKYSFHISWIRVEFSECHRPRPIMSSWGCRMIEIQMYVISSRDMYSLMMVCNRIAWNGGEWDSVLRWLRLPSPCGLVHGWMVRNGVLIGWSVLLLFAEMWLNWLKWKGKRFGPHDGWGLLSSLLGKCLENFALWLQDEYRNEMIGCGQVRCIRMMCMRAMTRLLPFMTMKNCSHVKLGKGKIMDLYNMCTVMNELRRRVISCEDKWRLIDPSVDDVPWEAEGKSECPCCMFRDNITLFWWCRIYRSISDQPYRSNLNSEKRRWIIVSKKSKNTELRSLWLTIL